MRSKLATYALAGAIGLTGVAGAALVVPAASYAATGDSTEPCGVGGHGPGHVGRGMHLAALEELGITAEEVRAAAQAGSSLAELAEEQGVERQALIDALVASHQERLDAAVADGRLTQAEADEKSGELEAHVTDRVDESIGVRGGRVHHGPHGGPGSTAQPGMSGESGSA